MTTLITVALHTVPDIAALRTLHDFPPHVSDRDVADWALQRRRAETGHDAMPPWLQQVVALSAVVDQQHRVELHRFSLADGDEASLLAAFFSLADGPAVRLQSWDAATLLLLRQRALQHALPLPPALRPQTTHCHALSQDYASDAPMDPIARLCGLPGVAELDAVTLWQHWLAGQHDEAATHAARLAANLYLLSLRSAQVCGSLPPSERAQAELRLCRHLQAQGGAWQDFLQAWHNRPDPA